MTFTALTIIPAFDAARTTFAAPVANNVTHVKVTPTVATTGATVEVGKGSSLAMVTSGSASTAIALDVGWNVINVKVTAADTTTTKTYVLTVSRAATNTLVSNVGQHGSNNAYTDKVSNAFTTGSNAAGYTLAGIDLSLDVSAASETYDLDLFSDSSGDPGTKLADLTAPTSLTTGIGPVSFTPPSNTTLTANTTYHVVLTASAGAAFLTADTDNEDPGSTAGWSIANVHQYFDATDGWTVDSFGESLAFHVRGAAATAGVTVSTTAFSFKTGTTAAYTVVLDSQPSASVTITPTSATTTAATVSSAVTFTTANWNEPQAITVTGVTTGSSVISHAAVSTDTSYNSISIGSVTATVGGGPAAPTMLSAPSGDASLSVTWTAPAGTLTGYDLHLTTAPASGTGAVANNAVESGTDRSKAWVPVSSPPGAASTFNTYAGLDNGTTYRVRLRAKTSAGVGAWAYTSGTPNIELRWSASTTTVTEGETGTGIRLSAGPVSEAVSGTLTYAPGDTNPASLSADLQTGYATTFSAVANAYARATLPSTVNDTVNEEDETFKITIDAGSGYVVVSPATIVVTIEDNDPPAAPSGLSLTAGAAKLAASWTKPVGPVTGYQLRYKVTTAMDRTATTAGDPSTGWVTVTPTGTGTTAEITSLDNGTAYHVQVRATDGQIASGNGYGDWSSSVTGTPSTTATLTLTTSAASNTVAEDGGSVTVTATLSSAATTAVSVTLTATGTATATADYSLPSALTIPIGSTSATGTVTIVDDDLDEANETVILTTTVSGYTVTPVTLTITDDDTAGVTVSETSRSVQAGSTTSYTVVLDSKPTANVTVGATSGTPANATVSPASRTFTPTNWDTAQSFTVTGVQAGSSTITHAATSTDAKYPSNLSIGSVQVTVTAQPPTTLALTTNAASNTIAENGGSVTVTATLNRAATTAVSVTLTATGTATGTADYSLPAAFTIPVGSTSATGTLTIVNDAVDEENETVILTTTVSGLTVTGVTLTITDDDTAGVTVSQTTRDVQDGATTTYTVVLDSKPAAHVVVAATSGTPAYATVAPASRTFSTTNWNTPQTFTVTGVASGSSTITHAVTSSGDSQYPTSLSIASVAVRVNPDDTTLSALSFSFSADGGATFPGSGKLSPEFDPATRTYTMELSPAATHVKFTPTANHPEATIEVNNVATPSGSASAAIPVSAGRVDVDVTSASRNVVETYRFVLSSGGGGAAGQFGNTVWTSVLVMRDLNPNDSGGLLGCHNSSQFAAGDRCSNAATLSQDTYYFAGAPGWSATDAESRGDNDWRASRQYGGVRINGLYTENQGANVPRKLVLSFTQNVPESLRQSLTLVFDGRSFPLREGVTPQNSPNAIEWSDTGIARNEHLDDQVVDVGLYLNPVGPDVTEWQPTMRARSINNSHAKAGCGGDIDCGDHLVFGGNRFSVNAPKYGGLRSYRITELSVEFIAQYGHSEIVRRVTLTVDEGGATVDLNDTWLVLTANLQTIMLPIRSQDRIGSGTWTWVESSDALSWGPYLPVQVGIHANTTGLQTVRVYYDEMKNGQPVDDFLRWDIARAKPHATLDQALIAVIPGEFVSLNTGEKAITTHAKLLLRGDWPGSTIEYGKGTWDAPPNTYTAVGADGLTGPIQLSAEKSNTYVWVKVTNGDQVHTHLVIIDPPPRTFSVNPELRVTEGETGRVTLSLGSPATKGGVSFNVTTAYGDGVTDDDLGEIVSTVTIPEGQRSASIAVPTIQDEEIEADERLTITLTHVGEPLWAVEPGKTGTTAVTIVNDDVGLEPWNIQVVPGDGALTVTWNVSSREGYEDSEIWHVLRWSQEFGVWANPRDPRAVGKNDGVSVDPGVTTFTITGLKNGVATGVFIRSMVGYRSNMSERDGASSKWVRTKGVHTTPVAPPNEAPTVASAISDATIANERGAKRIALSSVFSDADGDDLTITASSSNDALATGAVSADYSSLTVTARSRGTATITVTASDGKAEVSDTFTVTVKAAPAVASALSDIGSLAIGTDQDVTLTSVFSDADGDTLTLSAVSSATAVATVSVATDGSKLTVTGVAEGTATITVTAQDSDANSVSDQFDVTVPAANRAPTIASALSDATIVNTSGTKRVSLSGVFTDADGDSLTITAKSSATGVATVSVAADGASLTVTAKSRGTATITVTASDGTAEVSETFTVTVKAAPTVASPLSDIGSLPIGTSREVTLTSVFSDADNDALTLSAASSSNAVVTVVAQLDPVTASATAITVTGVAEGTATITVTARDSDGNSVSDAFDVTVPAAQQQQQQQIAKPGPVIDLTLTPEGDKVVVSWTAPELGSAPNGYIVHLKPEGGETGSGKTKRPKAKKTKVTYDKLEAGVTYNVWVRAQNESGKGDRVHATITLPAPQPAPVEAQ